MPHMTDIESSTVVSGQTCLDHHTVAWRISIFTGKKNKMKARFLGDPIPLLHITIKIHQVSESTKFSFCLWDFFGDCYVT